MDDNGKRYLMVITADTNDADYVYSTRIITESEKEECLKRLLKMKEINKSLPPDRKKPRQLEDHKMYEGSLTGEEIEWLSDNIPIDNYGAYTCKSVEFYPLSGPKVSYELNTKYYLLY